MTGVCNNDTDGDLDITFTIAADGTASVDLLATAGLCEVDSTYAGSDTTYSGTWGMWGNDLTGAWSS